jgi:tRNA threonylcarbamoyl adenosine modification protein YeaZ
VLALVVDTSSAAVQAAVVDLRSEPVVIAARTTIDGHAHGELLAASIRACLNEAGEVPAAVVAGTGPGPYTGLRVGLVTAAACASAWAVPAYGVCSLDGIGRGLGGDVLVATDARRREIYWARYVDGVRHTGPAVGPPADVAAACGTGPSAMAGAGARTYADVLGLPLVDRDYPDPASLAGLAADRARFGAPGEVLVPAYLREPDAVVPAALRR